MVHFPVNCESNFKQCARGIRENEGNPRKTSFFKENSPKYRISVNFKIVVSFVDLNDFQNYLQIRIAFVFICFVL